TSCSRLSSGVWKSGSRKNNLSQAKFSGGFFMRFKVWICALLFFSLLAGGADAAEALRKMTVGQAGVNPGAGLFTIAVNQGYYKKYSLDVEIIKTNTAAAVQTMLAGKMQMA